MPALAHPSIAVLKSKWSELASCMHTNIEPAGPVVCSHGATAAAAMNSRRFTGSMALLFQAQAYLSCVHFAVRILGVLDLLAGRAVHARAGQRDTYRPVHSVAGT